MIRVILFLVVVAILGLGFGWLADRPGDLVFTFAGQRHYITLMVAASLVVAVVAAVMLVWWIIKNLVRSPYILQRHFRARKRDRGYQSLSTGLIAAGAGDADAARRMSKQAAKLLSVDQEPLIRLLDVQTALLEGRKDDVRRHFEAMIADPETKLLGLRGLYLEASREGVREAAFQYAQEASTIAPQLEWATNAVLGHKALEGDVRGALQVLEARKAAIATGRDGKSARETLKHNRAVLLTAQAMAEFESDPVASRDTAAEAYKAEPELIPAALIAARCLLRDGNIRKGNRILEAAWKHDPHPDIAEAYIHGRTGDTALDRLKKARNLAALRTNSAESFLIVAKAALEAGELTVARENAQAALKLQPCESAYLLMADIEEAQSGDQGRVREWLARALKAPRDPSWTADGIVSSQWAPVSPVTGRLNAFEWKVPLAEMQSDRMPVLDSETFADEPVPVVISENNEARDVIAKPLTFNPVPRDEIEDAETISAVTKPVPVVETTLAPDQKTQSSATEEQDIYHRHHRLIVDDPGVNPETGQADKKESGYRLF